MMQVLEECDNVSADFSPDHVHDLRVSLRRCRSLADGLMAIHPDPDWEAMRKAGKRLFQRLGDLRDIHVMEEWVKKLEKLSAKTGSKKADEEAPRVEGGDSSVLLASPLNPGSAAQSDSDPAAETLLKILKSREAEQTNEAQAALEEFDRKQWRRWSKSLPARAARIRAGSALFKHLALERWSEARHLHTQALRSRSKTAFHSLRIGIKRFRYIVENFLPLEHKAWSDDLKEIQDLLGEVHDLDVLWSTAVSCHVFPNEHSRQRWQDLILSQRSKRIDRYRAKMIGEDSLWQVWRDALPEGRQIQELASSRMKIWANTLDPDFHHSERVAGLSLQLYDGLLASQWQPAVDAASARFSLLAAALLHDVGKSKGEKNHHKKTFKLIQDHGDPLGWKPTDFQRAAVVARFHRGALPTRRHKLLRDLFPDEQKATVQLAAILRLANALDAAHDGHILRIQVENVRGNAGTNHKQRIAGFLRKHPTLGRNEPLIIAAEGYGSMGPSAQAIAAERHLLETVLHRPVIVKPMRNRMRML
jgi:exopolyphosphatase/guanosine-5'-triphosphate,3'-diphosphate pyrophosphatase